MKRILVFLLGMIILIGCTEEVNDINKIAFMVSDLSNPFFSRLADYAVLEGEKRGYEIVVFDSGNDLGIEKENFGKLVDVDFIILNPIDSENSSSIVLEANAVNIPVVTVDRRTSKGQVISHIESDNYTGGQMAGELLLSLYREDDRILLIEGLKETTANKERVKGFRDFLQQANIPIDYESAADFSREKAYNMVKDFEETYEIVFAANDEMALGVVDWNVEQKYHSAVIGFDGTVEAVDAVAYGYLAGTIAQQPNLLAKHSLQVIDAYFNNEPIEPIILVDLKIISTTIK